MEDERPTFGLENLAVVFHTGDLTGRNTHDSAFLVIVILTAVDQVAALDILEKKRVKPERMAHVADFAGLRQVDDADQRMQGFDAQQLIVFEDVLEMFDRIHGFSMS